MSLDLDMKEIHEIFFEESFEGLDAMEAGLLALNAGAGEAAGIDNIFRAAHSIKGGAATFGFDPVSDFTHGVETLLDEIRAGDRALSEVIIETLLASVDCLRLMLDELRASGAVTPGSGDDLKAAIEVILQSAQPVCAREAAAEGAAIATWEIEFKPHAGLFTSGNEPQRIFTELATLGALTVNSKLDDLPPFAQMDPARCYLGWHLELETDQGEAAITEAFAWVGEHCDLAICKVSPAKSAETEQAADISDGARLKPRDSGSIRVGIDKVDALLNLVGELVIAQSMLKRCGDEYSADNVGELRDGLKELERYTRELQENAMQIRMLPISVSFSRFSRLVRDQSARLGKKVTLKLSGEQTELDKTVLEKMSDPLVHLVRNSLDHGIEPPHERVAAGKPESGVLHLSAEHEGGNIVIKVEDDGAGLNHEKILAKAIDRGLVSASDQLTEDQINNLIFQPGFSTADEITDLSGRGVGMDVVRRNIIDLGGRLEVHSRRGQGSSLTIRLPLTLAILDGQLVQVNRHVYIFSLLSITETVQVSAAQISDVVGGGKVYRLRDHYIPVVRLRDAFDLGTPTDAPDSELLVIVEADGCQFGVFVDDLLEQQQVVIKSLEQNYGKVPGLAGATILGDGRVALIIDAAGLFQSLISSRQLGFAHDPDQYAA